MPNATKAMVLSAALVFGGAVRPVHSQPADRPPPQVEIGDLAADADLTLRRMVVHNAGARQTIRRGASGGEVKALNQKSEA